MNKKTKSFAVGLVAVLCFLLVFAIGFGVTGAWYQAKRQASGTVKMDQGIYLKFTNLKTLDANGNKDLSDKMNGKLLLKNGTTPLEDVSVDPSQLVEISVPTLAAAQGSVDFYARVKVTYTAKYKNAGTGAVEGDPVAISETTMKELFGADLAGQLKPGEGWAKNADGYWYFATDGKLVSMTAAEAADGTDHAIFENGNLQFADWTAGNSTQNDPTKLVEKGGPTVMVDGVSKEIGQVIVTVLVEVIQAANNPAPTGWALNANA